VIYLFILLSFLSHSLRRMYCFKRIRKRRDDKCWVCRGQARMTRSHVLLHCSAAKLRQPERRRGKAKILVALSYWRTPGGKKGSLDFWDSQVWEELWRDVEEVRAARPGRVDRVKRRRGKLNISTSSLLLSYCFILLRGTHTALHTAYH